MRSRKGCLLKAQNAKDARKGKEMPAEFTVRGYTGKQWDEAFMIVADRWRHKNFHSVRLPLKQTLFSHHIEYRFYDDEDHIIVTWKMKSYLRSAKFEEYIHHADIWSWHSNWNRFAQQTKDAIWQDVFAQVRGDTVAAAPQPRHVQPLPDESGKGSGVGSKSVVQALPVKEKDAPARPSRVLNEDAKEAILIYASAIDKGEPIGTAIRKWGKMDSSTVSRHVRFAIDSDHLKGLLDAWHREGHISNPKITLALIVKARRKKKKEEPDIC